MAPRAKLGYLVGYVASNVWEIWFPDNDKVMHVRDAVFIESRRYKNDAKPRVPEAEIPANAQIISEMDAILAHHMEMEAWGLTPTLESIDQNTQFGTITDSNLTTIDLLSLQKPIEMEPRDVEPPETQPSEVHDRRDIGEKTPEPHTQLPTPTATPLPNLTEPTSPPISEPIEVDETPNLEEIEEENTLNSAEVEVETGTNRVESEVETISNKVESEPEEGDALTRAPNDINGDVDESNILQTTRTRRPRIDPDFQSFYSKFHLLEKEDREIRRAYTTAFNIGKTMPNRLHSDDLPPPPKSWKDLRTHPYGEMFYTAARIEIEALKSKGTFDVVDEPVDVSKQVLPLLWVFTYKLDANGYLIKAKARICATTPLPSGEILMPSDKEATASQIKEIQQKIGSIQYPANQTRPDIAIHASKLAQFAANPSQRHLESVDRVMSYLYQTRFHAIEYSPRNDTDSILNSSFVIAADASFADNHDTKSSYGYICKVYGGAVDWKSSKQRSVSTSTTEAEFRALLEVGKILIWWKRMLKAIGFELSHPTPILCDNAQTVRLLTSENPGIDTKLKHVNVAKNWLYERIQRGDIELKWISTSQMPADGLTKILPRSKFEESRRKLGMEDIRHLIEPYGEGKTMV
ncbi:hypothetical protein N7470_002622 [Penicillium chermesinum]|nr:hypothetical protein N7470_002622 [Penicillium chermesinum]